MDYTKQSKIFKIKKALRYLTMYGPSRTLTKIQGQYHMKKTFQVMPTKHNNLNSKQKVAIIGCGNYAYSNIAYYLKKNFGDVIGMCMDVDINHATSLAQKYSVPWYTDNADEIINNPHISLVYIASNHSTHAEYAIKALNAGKHVYIEKPHVVSMDQIERLTETANKTEGKIFLGFNRPTSRFGKIIMENLAKEEGSLVINWFVAGHEIEPDHWYFNKEEGGRVLGNLCHWTDFTLEMVGLEKAFPLKIIPTKHEKSDSNIAVTYVFGDGTVAAITFSAKGHTFEGVKERLSLHKGNLLLTMDDYKTMTTEIIDKKTKYINFFRDHGHEFNIACAFKSSFGNMDYNRKHMVLKSKLSALLFMKTKEALDSDKIIIVTNI